MVGVSTDRETEAVKGKVVMNEQERCEILRHCKWVDEVIFPGPWILTMEWLEENNVHDDLPNSKILKPGDVDIYYPFKKIGMFRATERSLKLSTSEIIQRILTHYDHHVLSLLQEGYSPQQLGVTLLYVIFLYCKVWIKSYL